MVNPFDSQATGRRLELIFEHSAGMLFVISPDFKVLRANKRLLSVLGLTAEEAIGRPCYEVSRRRDAPCEKCTLRTVMQTGRPVREEHALPYPDGSLHWFDISGYPLRDENGAIVELVEMAMDITERKKSELALRESGEKFRMLTESSRDAILHISLDGTILYANPAAEMWSGYTPAELIGTNVAGYFASEKDRERGFAEIQKVIKTGQSGMFEFLLRCKNGDILDVENSYAPLLKDGRVASLLLILRDISERKRAEKELATAHRLESVGILAGGIAHDFNNIMTGIFGNLQLAKLKLAGDHPAHKYIVRAWEATERATHLTKQLLTFAKGGEPILEAVGVKEVIEKIVSFNLSGSSVKASLNFPEELWPLKADGGQFGQVIANLVINALQAMPDGGVLYIAGENVERPDPAESTGLTSSGPFVKLTVKDAGVGIAPDLLPRVFDPYFTTKQTGNGLGLATVYSIVRRHNGHVGIVSEVGRGTTVTIYLPADLSGQTRRAAAPKEPDGALPGGGRALIMDDEELVRAVMGDMFETLGYSADFAGDGREAATKYREAQAGGAPYALVVMDLTIPGGMGGKEAVKDILAINPTAKVIVASGYSNDPVMAHFERYGFRGRLVKPICLEAMQAELARVMRQAG